MFDYLLNAEQRDLKKEVRDFVQSIPSQMILDMDSDRIQFPKAFLREAGRRNLMGCRYPTEWGGRGMDWVSTCMVMEEVGMLGYIFACIFGVGAELVCDAIRRLPEPYRRTVAMRYFGGVSAADIARDEGVDAGTVRWRLHQALKKMWIMLKPQLGEGEQDEQGAC